MRVVETQPFANLEELRVSGNLVSMRGWILHRASPLTHVTLRINGIDWVVGAALLDRRDVRRRVCRTVPHAVRSGFDVTGPLDRNVWRDGANVLELLASANGEPRGQATIAARDLAREHERFPVPAEILKLHVGLARDDFLATGWRVYSDLKRELERVGPGFAAGRILDWGCGCGRVLRYVLEDVPADRVCGCDIDREAVEWLAGAAAGASFGVILPEPPTEYPEESFDLVYGISVLTHLREEMQDRWLQELRRICKRGGYVAVTVHGADLSPRRLKRSLIRRGFAEMGSAQSSYFAPYAGGRYYRNAFHTADYIERCWCDRFELLEYICRGVNAHQDLVIMRRR